MRFNFSLAVLSSSIAVVVVPVTALAPSWSSSTRPGPTDWSNRRPTLSTPGERLQQVLRPFASCSSSSSTTTTTTSKLAMVSSSVNSNPEMASLYKEQERLLVQRGEREGQLMAGPYQGIQPNVIKGAGSSGGFSSNKDSSSSGSSGGSSGKKQLVTQGKAHAQVLETEGVVRMDHVLSADLADQLLAYVVELRRTAEEQVRNGECATLDRFANVLLRDNRCDLTIPLGSKIVADCLYQILEASPVASTIAAMLGPDAELYELSCMISDPGSQRQVMHPDTPFLKNGRPVLYTCFFALQDIERDMGPTTWMPRTHTQEAHATFKDDTISINSSGDGGGESPKDYLLRTRPAVLGLLPKGCCAIYDSRILHCGGANTSAEGKSRAIFYFSFKYSGIGYPGNPASIRKNLASQYNLERLSTELQRYKKGKSSSVLSEN